MSDVATDPAARDRPRDPLRGTWFWEFCRVSARFIVTFIWDLKVYGRSNVPRTGGVLLVANHQSYLDPIVIGVHLRRPMCFLAKSELFRNRFLNWLISSLNAFPVRQGAGDVGAVREMLLRLKQGWMLSMFPEGSRSETGELGPIEPGAALVLRRAGVPCVPVAIEGSYDAWPKGRRYPRTGSISVMYGKPMNFSGLKSGQITELIERTLHEMIAELREIRAQRRQRTW